MNTRLEDIVAKVFDMDVSEIHEDMGPATTGQWTSLRHVQLIASIEDAYQVKFSPREIRSVRSVSKLRDVLRGKTAGRENN